MKKCCQNYWNLKIWEESSKKTRLKSLKSYFVSEAQKFKNYFFLWFLSNLQISMVLTIFLHIIDTLLIKYDMMIFFSGFPGLSSNIQISSQNRLFTSHMCSHVHIWIADTPPGTEVKKTLRIQRITHYWWRIPVFKIINTCTVVPKYLIIW